MMTDLDLIIMNRVIYLETNLNYSIDCHNLLFHYYLKIILEKTHFPPEGYFPIGSVLTSFTGLLETQSQIITLNPSWSNRPTFMHPAKSFQFCHLIAESGDTNRGQVPTTWSYNLHHWFSAHPFLIKLNFFLILEYMSL
jgi:hypothetical protein